MATASGSSGAAGQSLSQINVFPDEKKVRELAEQIRARLSHAHQLKLTASQQQQSTPAAAMQITQAEEIKKRLQDAILQLQESVRDFSLTGIQEWLGVVAQRLNLKLDVQRSQQLPGTTIFLCHEGFYVEVCCQDNDTVTSVKLSQANTAQEDSVVLALLLVNRDFSGFETHLKSLVQFYNQATKNCDPSLMYKALSAMEAVFIKINDNSPQTATDKMIMENPLGHVTPRHGGLPMQLTFFVHPHEVIKNALLPSELGVSVGVAGKVTMEKSPKVFMLSTDPNLFDVSTANFYLVSVRNSAMLPLTFVFELSEAIPVCSLVRDELLKICGTEQSMLPVGSIHINQLVAKRKADKEGREVLTDKWRLVCLPDQYHYYLMPPELRSVDALPDQIASPQFCGAMVTKVPFLHPGKIFNIIMLLRKQLVYNALISSCMGRSKRGVPSPTAPEVTECIFEVASIPPNQVTVAMDMQSEETMIVDFIVPDQDPTAVKVRIKTNMDSSPLLQDLLSDIAQRCLSVPVTLRAALKHPSRLLSNNPALLVQKYRQSLSEFDKAVHSLEEKEPDSCLMGGAPMDVSDHVTLLGQERDLTSMM